MDTILVNGKAKAIKIEVKLYKLLSYPNLWVDPLTGILYVENEDNGEMKKIDGFKSSSYKTRVLTS